ncbi:FBP1-like protein [Mya arenaria]|uniref:FBP1-like protein n=1 Tax=Mya arenaria TaxID=6604 RepID=A0ABY7DD50_MYAAR|nr:FBP1-like protein [Mya arenaria]
MSLFVQFNASFITPLNVIANKLNAFSYILGWIIHKANCYKKVDVDMTFNEASTTCNLEGAHLFYPANELEYDEVIARNAPGIHTWIGFMTNGTHIGRTEAGLDTPSDRIPRWANNEPTTNMHDIDCILVDNMKGLMVRACDEMHPFFCKRRACLKGYMSCDMAAKCVPETRKCDGKFDCSDTSDELDCPNDMNYIDVERSGSFSTHTLYPGQNRIWTIKAPIGRRIKLYVPSMTLETNVAFLEVWTGNPTFAVSRLIKKFTSTVNAGVYLYSDNNYMTVRLYANNLQQNFNAKTLSYTADNTNIFRGYKDLDASVGLSSLIFPYQGFEYKPEGLQLRWRITASGGDYITYYVEPIDKTKPTSGKIRGGMTNLAPGDVRVTGRNELHITMEGVPENLQLMYKSGCGGITLTHEYGEIHLFDELIPHNATCTWTLKGGEAVGRGLALKFMNDLYDDPRTTFAKQSMDVFTIEGSGGTEIGVENYPEMIYHSSDGNFKVTFQSDVALNSKSSRLEFGADCPALKVSEQTELNKNTSYFNEDVLLTCSTGYDFNLEKYALRESLTLRCTQGSWYIDDDKLATIPECKLVFCGAPPKVNNAYVTYASGASYMSVATYACNEGLNMEGGPIATCMGSGEWEGLPSCSSSSCKALPEDLVQNGGLKVIGGNDFSGASADFNTVVQFFCNDGYEMVGTVRTYCNIDGWTHGNSPPTCKVLSCPIPSLPNAEYNLDGEVNFEDFLTVSCQQGFQFMDRSENTPLNMNCQANQTFDIVDECIDIDECKTGSSGCNLDSTVCRNTIGGHECVCKDGFNNPTGVSCLDINECSVNNGGCYNFASCENAPGSYSCSCPSGHKLFEEDGDQGFTLQASETGLGENDMYRINHTCVPLECPEFPDVQNGLYLTSETMFHFKDGVEIHCADGYFFASDGTTTSDTDGTLACTAAGDWDKTPSCSARECTFPVNPLNGMYDKERVVFGEQLTLTCNLSESEQITRQAMCLYNGTDNGVVFGGDDITVCPVKTCGDPDDVMPQAGTYSGNKPPTFTYWPTTSKFTFDCLDGFSVTGHSEEGDMNVKCKANSRWSLQSLGCFGEMCIDHGTPGDANQIASSYDIGATLSYACKRTGFKPTGPDNYTCRYINGAAVWSGNLGNVLPTCEDIREPTYDACQTEPQTAFKMQSADFKVPTFSDNFAILSVSKSGLARPGDVLTSNENVSYTANDFNGNSATCSNYIVVSERKKPSTDCPSQKIISVGDRGEAVYYVSDWKTQYYQEVDAHTTELLSIVPASVTSNVSKIGVSEEIVVTIRFADGTNVGEEAQCKFRVFYEAGDCFEESLFSDSFSTTDCTDAGVGGLECTRTCRNGYVFGNGAPSKTFICTSPNTWDFDQADPTNRYCLPIQNSDDTIDIQVYYDYAYSNHNCFGNYFTKVKGELSTFENKIRSSCNLNWDVQVVTAALVKTTKFSATLKLTLLSTATTTEKNNCYDIIRYNSALFNFGNNQLACSNGSATISVNSTATGNIEVTCRQNYHFKVPSTDLTEDVCVPCGPGLIYNSSSQSCEACPDVQYSGNTMQRTCLSCNSGSYPNVAGTHCQVTCPAGYTSPDGFYPCTPCPADSYSVNTTTCKKCPNGGSTVGVPAASSERQCFDPCPEGQYSLSGYMYTACNPCPLHHYQATPGMTYCEQCPSSHMTLQMGSVNSTFCLPIEDCNSAYCNDRGTCVTAFGRKNCQCADGYYGEQCEDNYHICNGNPCTNGGTCVPGDGPTDYTCTCVTDYDVCIMETKAEMMLGNVTGQLGFSIVQDKTECEQLCLEDDNCIEATYLKSSIGISACTRFNTAAYLETAYVAGTVHMTKHCTPGFTGDICEIDNIDNCNNSQCHEYSRCLDKINGYECICSSSGGFAVKLQQIPVMIYHANMEHAKVLTMFDMNALAMTDECNEHPDACMYGGTCLDRVNGYQCNCMSGFSGEHCENVPNYCSPVYICDMQDTSGKILGDPEPNVIGYVRIVQSIQECKDLCQYEPDCGYAEYQEFPAAKACLLYQRGTLNEIDNAISTIIKKDCSIEGTHYNCNRKATPCDTITCYNNGTCSDNGFVANCQCAAGFWGTRCQYSVDDCVNNNCQNGAVCVDGYLGFTCECPVGFVGNQCETNTDDCPGLCNTIYGICQDLVDGYKCVCEPGYQGSNCELEIDECLSYPCKHGAECEDMVNDYSCKCKEGWTGKNCDMEIDHCKTRSCENSGECEGGALGENCENATLVCDVMSGTDVCQNGDYDVRRCYFDEGLVGFTGGTSETLDFNQAQSLEECKTRCLQKPNCGDMREKFVSTSDEPTRVHYRRICPTDYTGDSCEQVKDWCSEENNPCKNGGECTPKGPVGYTCMCKPGYSGVTCNIDADPCSTNPCAGVARCQSTMIPQDRQNSLHPNYQDYMYWISVSRRGIWVKNDTSSWLGVTFNEDFGSELGDGSWHHFGIAIVENGMLSATLDAITIDDAVEVVSPPAGEKNVQISLGYLNLAEYQDVSVWDVTLTSRDFALASVGTQPSVNPIQGWWNYDPKTSGIRLTERLQHNLLDDPNIHFPQINCDGFENIMHVSAERVVDRDTFVGKIEEVKENTNETLTFKHSLPPSLTWGFYETVVVDNDVCPAARSDNTLREVCPSNADAVCDLTCLDPNEALFAPVPKYISCGTLGVWDTTKPYDDLVLPGCTIRGDPILIDVLMNNVNGEKWTGLCTGAMCDNLAITKAACISNTNMFEVGFILTYASNTITAVGGGETSVLDALRIIILLEKDLGMQCPAALVGVKCAVGIYYDVDVEQCVDCKRHYFQNMTGQHYCFPCQLGYKTVGNRSTSIDDCTEECLPGYVRNPQNLTECVRCDRGTFRSTQDDCIPCTDGKYTLEDTIAMDSSYCDMDICDLGKFWNVTASVCQPCDFGYYQDEMYQLQCKVCASDFSTRDMGAQNDSFCEFYCPAGQELNADKCGPGEINTENGCVKCPIDTYQTMDHPYSSIECQLCQKDGIFETGTIATGVSNSDECKPFCASGYIINAKSTGCDPCSRGSYKNNEDSRFAAECTWCPVGTTTDGMASTHVDNCSIPVCTAGQYILNGACTECPIDTFSTKKLPTSETECLSCTDECDLCVIRGTEGTGASSVEECRAYCPSGRMINADFNGCIPCPIGMYKDNTLDSFSSECTPCPDGSATQNVGATQASQCTSHEEESSPAVIIGTSIAGGLLLIVVMAFLIYRLRNRNKKLPEEESSDMTDASNPMNVYNILHDGENDIPTSTDEYYVIPADLNVSVTGDAQASTGTNANGSSIHDQNTDTASSERDVYTQLDVDSSNDKDKEYLCLYSHDSIGYLVPLQLRNISDNTNEEGHSNTSVL